MMNPPLSDEVAISTHHRGRTVLDVVTHPGIIELVQAKPSATPRVTLLQKFGTHPKRTQVIADCVKIIEQEVANKSGISGMAISASHRMVETFKPGFVSIVMDVLFDDFCRAPHTQVNGRSVCSSTPNQIGLLRRCSRSPTGEPGTQNCWGSRLPTSSCAGWRRGTWSKRFRVWRRLSNGMQEEVEGVSARPKKTSRQHAPSISGFVISALADSVWLDEGEEGSCCDQRTWIHDGVSGFQ
jgi:hypothetical protein